MVASSLIHWLAFVLVAIVFATAIFVTWWALFHDRPRGRRRCPKCWYDLTYSPGMTCAECGFTARQQWQLLQTRRRYGVATLAILVCVGLAGVIYDRANLYGWVSLMPTEALILSMPLTSDMGGDVHRELHNRMASDALSDRQWRMLLRRCAKGDWNASPPADEWVDRYGRLVARWRGSLRIQRESEGGDNRRMLTEREEILLEIPPRLVVSTRDAWPVNSPVHVDLRFDDWWPVGVQSRLRVQTGNPDGEELVLHRGPPDFRHAGFSFSVPSSGQGEQEIEIRIAIERRIDREQESWQHIEDRVLHLTTRHEGSIEDHVDLVESNAMTSALQRVFRGEVVAWDGGRSPVRFRYIPRASYSSVFDNVAIGASVRLYYGDRVARHLRMWWLGGTGSFASREDRGLGFEVVEEDLELLAGLDETDPRWWMEIRGDPAAALRAGPAEACWVGSFTLPVTVVRSSARAPNPEWWTERRPAARSGERAPAREPSNAE